MDQHDTPVAIGRYNEDRTIYQKSALFTSAKEPRTVHLGIDLFVQSGVRVLAPLDSTVHSFQNNNNDGDYGPTIILQHDFNDLTFYTLYGHLTLDSIESMDSGQFIPAGRPFAKVGDFPVNGNWPPHLHFQIITDMQGHWGDFPGVAATADRSRLLERCPDPNLILGISEPDL
ncbi:MAG: peptidoglycan DD-metalloendopeptidase family protein [Caldithrix sp.]|nr:peptidoglycan DD-metalloendopeptidase family protein [Caldithrix sp.]